MTALSLDYDGREAARAFTVYFKQRTILERELHDLKLRKLKAETEAAELALNFIKEDTDLP